MSAALRTSSSCADIEREIASHLLETPLPSIPLLPEFVQIGLVQPINVQEKEKGNLCPSNKLVRQNALLLTQNALLVKENDALKSTMHHSGYFDKVGTEGLVKRRGKPVERMPAKALRRRKAAATVLEMAIMVQGPSLPENLVELVKLAGEIDPQVLTRLSRTKNLLPDRKVKIPDKREDSGYRLQDKKVCSRMNAWLWQCRTTTKSTAILEQRTLIGDAVIDHPDKLQSFGEAQPEIPPIEFVVPDHPDRDIAASMYVPPAELLETLLSNTKVSSTIRWDKPYEKLKEIQKYFLWYLVSGRSAYMHAVSIVCLLRKDCSRGFDSPRNVCFRATEQTLVYNLYSMKK